MGFQGKGKLSQQNIATKLQTHSESKKKNTKTTEYKNEQAYKKGRKRAHTMTIS